MLLQYQTLIAMEITKLWIKCLQEQHLTMSPAFRRNATLNDPTLAVVVNRAMAILNVMEKSIKDNNLNNIINIMLAAVVVQVPKVAVIRIA